MSKLTVVIPTWNQSELLRHCLHALHHQSLSCQILVVDNGSTDGTEEMIEEMQSDFSGRLERVDLGANWGFARAVNEGIQATQTEFVALLNNDTEADPRWIEVGLSALVEFSDYSFFASRIINYRHRHALDSAGDGYSRGGIPYKRGFGQPRETYPEIEPVLGASAAAAFYRRVLFKDIGFFDEDFFMYLEDVDWSLRAQLAGHRCLYLPEAVVYHLEAASDPGGKAIEVQSERTLDTVGTGVPDQRPDIRPRYSPQRVYWITRNRWQLMITYQPLRHIPWLIYGWTRSLASHLLMVGFLGSFLLGLYAGLLSTPHAFRKRLGLRRKSVLPKRDFYTLLRNP